MAQDNRTLFRSCNGSMGRSSAELAVRTAGWRRRGHGNYGYDKGGQRQGRAEELSATDDQGGSF